MNRRRRWLAGALIAVGIGCLVMAWHEHGITGAYFTEDAGAPTGASQQDAGGWGAAEVLWLAGGVVASVAAGTLLTLRRRR